MIMSTNNDKPKGADMKSYKDIAEAAGTTVDVVREVAKTIYQDVTGWHESGNAEADPWAPGYRTKAEAIEAVCKRKQAEESKAETDTTEADTDYTPRVYAPMDVEAVEAAACKAIDTHTPARIEADGIVVHDEIVAVHDIDAAVTTKHFGDLGTPGDVRPCDRAEGGPATMRTAYGALKAVRRVDFMHEWYESMGGANRKGERITIELDTIDHGGQPGYLLTEWAKRGYVEPMAMAWCVNVYVTRADGTVYQGCNPQITPGGEIAWAWILPATEANKNAILLEILERFGAAE